MRCTVESSEQMERAIGVEKVAVALSLPGYTPPPTRVDSIARDP